MRGKMKHHRLSPAAFTPFIAERRALNVSRLSSRHLLPGPTALTFNRNAEVECPALAAGEDLNVVRHRDVPTPFGSRGRALLDSHISRGGSQRHTHRCRPGACPRDPLASARGEVVQGLYPASRERGKRPIDDRSEEHTYELQSLMRNS